MNFLLICPKTIRLALATVLLALILSPSARGQTPETNKWEAAIQAFEAADKTNPPPKNAILFIGSSSIRMWKTLARDFPGHTAINRGFGGSQIADSVRYLDRIALPYEPKMVLLYAGDNDIAAGKSPEQVLTDFQSFVEKIHAAQPKTRIAFLSIKPSIARRSLMDKMKTANEMVRDYARGNDKLLYIDLWSPMLDEKGEPRKELFIEDGLHLNAEGYALWTSRVKPHLP